MDLTDLIGRAIETESTEIIGRVVGFRYYQGRLVLTVAMDEEEWFDDDDPDPGEEAPEEEAKILLKVVGE
jgi:hypothetical protein